MFAIYKYKDQNTDNPNLSNFTIVNKKKKEKDILKALQNFRAGKKAQAADEHCWAITRAGGGHSAADHVTACWSFNLSWTLFVLHTDICPYAYSNYSLRKTGLGPDLSERIHYISRRVFLQETVIRPLLYMDVKLALTH